MEILQFKKELDATQIRIANFISEQLHELEKKSGVPSDHISCRIDRINQLGMEGTYYYSVQTSIDVNLELKFHERI